MKTFYLTEAMANVVNSDEYAEAFKKTRYYICNKIEYDKRCRWMYKNLPLPVGYNKPVLQMRRIIENLKDVKNIEELFFGWMNSSDIFAYIAAYELSTDCGTEPMHEYANGTFKIGDMTIILPQPDGDDVEHEALTDEDAENLAYAINIMRFYEIDEEMQSKIAYNIALRIVGRPDNLDDLKAELEYQIDMKYRRVISSTEYLEAYFQFDNSYNDYETYFNEVIPCPINNLTKDKIGTDGINIRGRRRSINDMRLNGYFVNQDPFVMAGSGYHKDVEKLAISIFDIMEGEIHRIESMGDGKVVIDDGTVLTYKRSPSNISDILYIYSIFKFYGMNKDELVELCENMMN